MAAVVFCKCHPKNSDYRTLERWSAVGMWKKTLIATLLLVLVIMAPVPGYCYSNNMAQTNTKVASISKDELVSYAFLATGVIGVGSTFTGIIYGIYKSIASCCCVSQPARDVTFAEETIGLAKHAVAAALMAENTPHAGIAFRTASDACLLAAEAQYGSEAVSAGIIVDGAATSASAAGGAATSASAAGGVSPFLGGPVVWIIAVIAILAIIGFIVLYNS
jgi:hypothetical protein